MEEIYTFDFQTPAGIFYCLYKMDDGHRCAYLGREANRFQAYKGLLLKKYKGSILFKEKRSQCIEDQVISYLSGKTKNIDLAFTFLTGTDFQKSIWHAIIDIGYGKVASYKDVARMVNKPKAYRAVGNALGKNPIIMLIPCHRVIQSNGSLGYFSSGVDLKKHLLELEGKSFS
jgi:methylated-DNA-[protein]-cysteine S-methyltransferase